MFLSRHNLRLALRGPAGCSVEDTLFPNTGFVSRRNLYQAGAGLLYVVGQYDARVIDVSHCTITLSEFRTLDRNVTFLGSFDEDEQKRWTYFPASQRPELPFEKREQNIPMGRMNGMLWGFAQPSADSDAIKSLKCLWFQEEVVGFDVTRSNANGL